jgi:hypothetical protein
MLTLQEYLDPGRFPLMTQAGLTPMQQLFLDAFNYEKLKEFTEDAGLPHGEPKAIWAELQVKEPYIARLTAEAAAVEAASKGRGK